MLKKTNVGKFSVPSFWIIDIVIQEMITGLQKLLWESVCCTDWEWEFLPPLNLWSSISTSLLVSYQNNMHDQSENYNAVNTITIPIYPPHYHRRRNILDVNIRIHKMLKLASELHNFSTYLQIQRYIQQLQLTACHSNKDVYQHNG